MNNSIFKIKGSAFTQVLMSCALCLMSFAAVATSIDSVRMETINGKQFIIHQVDPKETLYSISRKYGVPVAAILEQNPGADSGLAVGRELKVPYVPKSKPRTENGNTMHRVAPKETLFSISKTFDVSVDDLKNWNNLKDNSISLGQDLIVRKRIVATDPKITDARKIRGAHTVTDKETLFSISKMYGATVQQLKEWNKLSTDEVKPGQMLYVLPPMSTNDPVQAEVKQSTQQIQPIKPVQEIKISETVIGLEEIHEKGMAALLEGTDGNRKYLAQHRTAKTGTIMKVRNSANNQEVFVRVVAPLTSPDETLVKISKSAYDKLGAIDLRFAVEVIRYK